MFSLSTNKIFFLFFILFCIYNTLFKNNNIIKAKSDLHIYDLKINHLSNPLGIDIYNNTFSFKSDREGPFKVSLISLKNNETFQSKKIYLSDCHSFYFNKPLEYQTSYIYRVEDNDNINELIFETAVKLNASFIKPKDKKIESPIFIREFEINDLKKVIKKARLYITGLGLYQAYINDKKVGKGYLTPGYNDYDFYLRYQTYDIFNLLQEKNKIEVHMGNGWYKGRFWTKRGNIFGDEYKLCALIYLEFNNGTKINIYTDNFWKLKKSKEIMNNIYDGEIIDYTLPESPLEDVEIDDKIKYNLIPDFGALIEEKEILKPTLVHNQKKELILDFGQNIVGFVRYRGYLKQGQELKITHSEILQKKSLYNINFRSAKAIAQYKGDGTNRIYEPKFTYFGFRYAKIEGLTKNELIPEDFEGVVIYTNLEKTISFDSYDIINNLMMNTLRSQKGNFLDVPTDCPQRDERLGWTGDAQVFSNTACYNMDSYIFYKKYMKDLRVDQENYFKGDIPYFSPSLKRQGLPGGAVWADAATIIPWNIYLNYGDKNLLKETYPLMKDYVSTLINKDKKQGNKHLILAGFTFGDWLALDGPDPSSSFGGTDNGFIMSVYYYHSVDLISLAAYELGYYFEYTNYNNLKNNIYKAIINEFFEPDGNFKLDTQTSYVLSLHYKIYKNKNIIINNFKKRLEKDSNYIKTGFTGTPLILISLFDNDMDEYAYRLLYNVNSPGWIYPIILGATSIWERWDSILPDGTINKYEMNSLNHYAYGSVCESIYSRIGGLINLKPGWKKVRIKPHINLIKKSFYLSYNSISGKYIVDWQIKEDKKFIMKINIPNGCEAEVILPNGYIYNVKSGKFEYECEINMK